MRRGRQAERDSKKCERFFAKIPLQFFEVGAGRLYRLEHVLIEKVCNFFGTCSKPPGYFSLLLRLGGGRSLGVASGSGRSTTGRGCSRSGGSRRLGNGDRRGDRGNGEIMLRIDRLAARR